MRVVETLGAEKALHLLYCTEDLEEAGGLMTLVNIPYYISLFECLSDRAKLKFHRSFNAIYHRARKLVCVHLLLLLSACIVVFY